MTDYISDNLFGWPDEGRPEYGTRDTSTGSNVEEVVAVALRRNGYQLPL
ncbi:MAG: hypothetical protein WC648_04555 [Candidatus Paceibacterota bacterium]